MATLKTVFKRLRSLLTTWTGDSILVGANNDQYLVWDTGAVARTVVKERVLTNPTTAGQ